MLIASLPLLSVWPTTETFGCGQACSLAAICFSCCCDAGVRVNPSVWKLIGVFSTPVMSACNRAPTPPPGAVAGAGPGTDADPHADGAATVISLTTLIFGHAAFTAASTS